MRAHVQNVSEHVPILIVMEENMKKLLLISSLAFVLGLSGCVGWAHWGATDNRDRRQDQPRDQHQDQRDRDQHQDPHQNR